VVSVLFIRLFGWIDGLFIGMMKTINGKDIHLIMKTMKTMKMKMAKVEIMSY